MFLRRESKEEVQKFSLSNLILFLGSLNDEIYKIAWRYHYYKKSYNYQLKAHISSKKFLNFITYLDCTNLIFSKCEVILVTISTAISFVSSMFTRRSFNLPTANHISFLQSKLKVKLRLTVLNSKLNLGITLLYRILQFL